MTAPSTRIERLVTGLFGPGAEPPVLERLARIEDPMGHEVSERVHAAVVLASQGDHELLERWAHEAEVDWRDVLVAAHLADTDWPDRLEQAIDAHTITRWDGPPIDAWDAWTPSEAADRLAGVDVPWCVVAGWAVDLAVGATTRPHGDLEIAVLRRDVPAVRRHLGGFAFHLAGGGQVRRLDPDEPTPSDRHQHWVLDAAANRWRVDVMAQPGDDDTWAYRRDPTLRAPRSFMVGHTADGIPHLRPHGVLLFKAKVVRPKDERDFDAALPIMAADERAWLRAALERFHPGHRWIGHL